MTLHDDDHVHAPHENHANVLKLPLRVRVRLFRYSFLIFFSVILYFSCAKGLDIVAVAAAEVLSATGAAGAAPS